MTNLCWAATGIASLPAHVAATSNSDVQKRTDLSSDSPHDRSMRTANDNYPEAPVVKQPLTVIAVGGEVVVYAPPQVVAMSPEAALDLARRLQEAVARPETS